MQDRYWLYQRKNGIFYLQDKITGKQQSTRTDDEAVAKLLLAAKNQSVEQPMLNRSMAKAYLSVKSPDLLERTWEDVMNHYAHSGVEATRERKDRPFAVNPLFGCAGSSCSIRRLITSLPSSNTRKPEMPRTIT